ncbi:MAG TPA: FxLYD domain-containing protein [Candidatus Baltobacteraceae bacterium]|nr:FxLYD domain-containing protein [Candidatus Baltobacteraceae bacterium]
MKLPLLALALASTLGACAGNPQRLPVGLSLCEAAPAPGGFTVSATVHNTSEKPVTSLALSLAFYRDFRYSQFTAATRLPKELDPGEKREVKFEVRSPSKESGQAMRCLVTHIGYMDGTSADLPPAQ